MDNELFEEKQKNSGSFITSIQAKMDDGSHLWIGGEEYHGEIEQTQLNCIYQDEDWKNVFNIDCNPCQRLYDEGCIMDPFRLPTAVRERMDFALGIHNCNLSDIIKEDEKSVGRKLAEKLGNPDIQANIGDKSQLGFKKIDELLKDERKDYLFLRNHCIEIIDNAWKENSMWEFVVDMTFEITDKHGMSAEDILEKIYGDDAEIIVNIVRNNPEEDAILLLQVMPCFENVKNSAIYKVIYFINHFNKTHREVSFIQLMSKKGKVNYKIEFEGDCV
jgi:hypothetical protein